MSSEPIDRKINGTWSRMEDRQWVRDALAQYDTERCEREPDRVRLAILKTCEGDIDRVVDERQSRTIAMRSWRPNIPKRLALLGRDGQTCPKRDVAGLPRFASVTESNTSNGFGVSCLRHRRDSDVMRPLRYSINVTLDGCCDRRAVLADEDLRRHAVENLAQADALLFGRVTFVFRLVDAECPATWECKPRDRSPALLVDGRARIELAALERRDA